ncbi:uncharacterized protein LOC124162852 isoform X2 [Ischnura elegans]|uniref:uncharacterized protein LOC124162852 isoform X2 n=1 Tax=Ischnura elegans TaxID=197161 RepID=UPI001ED8A0D5|nr:uncharacterized protein LOC124162852 isoform X2 [Ischnura elegans]
MDAGTQAVVSGPIHCSRRVTAFLVARESYEQRKMAFGGRASPGWSYWCAPADNIEIIPSVPDQDESDSFEDSEKIWKSPVNDFNTFNDSDGTKEQLQHSNHELILQKKWLEEQNSSLTSILKNSEDSNASLQTNFDNLKKENEYLKLSLEGMKVLRIENDELKELLSNADGKCLQLKELSEKWEQEANSCQKALDELESEKNGLKIELELSISNEKELIGVIESQSQKLESLTLEKKASEEKIAEGAVRCEELQAKIESLKMTIKNHEEEKEEMEDTLAKMQQQYWTSSPRNGLELSNVKLSPKYVAELGIYEEVRDECKTLYKDLLSESPAASSEEPAPSIETELKSQEGSGESELLCTPEVKSLQESIATYLEKLKNFNLCADAMVQVQHSGRGCLSEMTVKDAEEEGEEEHRLRAGEDAWMQFHADEGSEAPSCACSHEAGHPSPERLRRLQVVREVAALRSQILRSQAVLAALAHSSDLLGVPEAASAARGVSDYGDVYDVGSVGSAATQHGHQPRSMESVAPSLPCVGGRASSGAFGTVGEIAEEGESGAGGECGRNGRRQLTKSCPALTSQVSIATQVDAEDLLTPSSVRAAAKDAATVGDGEGARGGQASSPKRARSSSFLAAIEGGTLSEEEEEEVFSRLPPSSPSPRHSEDPSRACSVAGTQTNTEESEEGESTAESSEPATEAAHVAAVFEPRVDSLDLDEYRSVRKLSVLPEENEEAAGGAVDVADTTSSPQRSSLRRPRASPPAPPPYRPPPNPYRPHSRSFESYLDPEEGLRRREELTGSGGRLGVPRQCSDPTPSASTNLLTTVATVEVHRPPSDAHRHPAGDASPAEDLSRSPLRHSSTTRPLELFGGGAAGKAVRFDGTPLEATAGGDGRGRKPQAFSHRRLLFPPPTSTSPLAEEEETAVPQSPRTPDSPGGGGQSELLPRMEQDQEGRDLAAVAAAAAEADGEDEEAMSREAGRRLRIRRRSTPGSPAAAIKRSAAVDYGEGSEDGGGNSTNVVQADVISPVATPYPSLTDPTLNRMGLLSSANKQEGGQTLSESLSEQDIENKFTSLSLAFKTDRITLSSRLELQHRQRDLAEKNVLSEIKQLKSTLNCLNHLCTDMETTELLAKIRHQVDVLQHSAQRVSSHAEMYGAVQQESRVSAAIEVMLLHVENLKRLHEKDHGELEDTKRILMENNIVLECGGEASEEGRASQRTARYRSLQSLVGANKMGSRRRASIAAIPRMPGRVDAFILPSHMDVGGIGRVSVAGSLVTSSAAPTTIAVTEGEIERRRESFASQILSYGNCLPTESPEKPSWSVTPPGEEEDETNMADDVSEPGASSWDGLESPMLDPGDSCGFNSLSNSNEDSRRCKRRSLGAGDQLVYRRDGLTARTTEGKGNKDRWTISSTLTMVRPYLSFNTHTISTIFRDWLGRWIKAPWLSQSGSLALVQEKGLTLLHTRHCLTCILLVVAVLSLGATIVSTDAHIDRWQKLKGYHYELGKILRPYVTLTHYTRPPM